MPGLPRGRWCRRGRCEKRFGVAPTRDDSHASLQLVFHADFYGVLPAVAVAAADACAAACVGGASVALLHAAAQPLKTDALPQAEPPRSAAALAVATSAFWGIAWVRLLRLRATQPDAAPASDALKLLWLPMAPLYTLLCEHVERSVQDTFATVRCAAGSSVLLAVLRRSCCCCGGRLRSCAACSIATRRCKRKSGRRC